MDMRIETKGEELTAIVEGRLDTISAPEFEKRIGLELSGVTQLILEFEKLDYISSAGLRVLLSLQKKMTAKNGTMVVRQPGEMVLEVFEVTGFEDILTIQR